MRRRNEISDQIIIKRRSKRGHQEVHSGAWKVAFADFALAMMALFMVLWIIQPQADAERKAIRVQNAPSVFEGGAGVFDGESSIPFDFAAVQEPDPVEILARQAPVDNSQPLETERFDTEAELQALAKLMSLLAERADALANVEVQVVPQGLRILIKDDDKRFMFERGSATINPHFRALLGALAKELAKVDNKLIISGHTDATPYRGKRDYDNWNLSGERALQARGVMVAAGLPATGVLQVSAQADVMPLRPEDPQSGVNRRIELLLLTGQAETLYRQLFSDSYAQYGLGKVDYIKPVGAPVE